MTSSDLIPVLLFVLTVAFATAGYFFRQFAKAVEELRMSVHGLDKSVAVLTIRMTVVEKVTAK